jgi:DNA-binding MarR family transcriptional regulator
LSTHPRRGAAPALDPREAWHRLLQVSSVVLRELHRSLDADDRIAITEFDVLITLDNAPDHAMRMTDLAEATMLSSGGMTRLVGRLEQRGLLLRTPDPADARAFRATLTADGEKKLADARVTHDAVLDRLIAPHITARDLRTVERALGRVLDGCDS